MNAIVQGAVVHWRDYLDLCKPRVVALIMFTAIVGMFLAVPGTVPMQAFVFGTLGIGMAAGSAAAAGAGAWPGAGSTRGRLPRQSGSRY